MKHHVLAGDALAADFRNAGIDGEIIVCRECLIDGDTQADSLEEFWKVRARFIESAYGGSDYGKKVVGEFENLLNLPDGAEVNLWFEYELFCQVNMWFCLSLLQDKKLQIYRVAPTVRNETDVWKGFGSLEKEDLRKCFSDRIEFSETDIQLGAKLWAAFQNRDSEELKKLGATESDCFPKLAEVCKAAIEIEERPKDILRKISANETNFENIFAQFSATEGVYGFGDAQVKAVLREI